MAGPTTKPHGSQKVFLDVGGVKFVTTVATLGAAPDGFLATLVRRDGCGTDAEPLFVDRDPELFRQVLKGLRTAHFVFPPREDKGRHAEYMEELLFYGLHDVVEAAEAAAVSRTRPGQWEGSLEEDDRARLREEKNMRRQLVEAPSGPHDGVPLVELFAPGSVLAASIIREEPSMYRRLLDGLGMAPAVGKAVVGPDSIEAFVSRFCLMFPNTLNRLISANNGELDWIDAPLVPQGGRIVVAGGSVLAALLAGDTASWAKNSDVDLFLVAGDEPLTDASAKAAARECYDALAFDFEPEWLVSRSAYTIDFHRSDVDRGDDVKCQLILHKFSSITELLVGFDVDVACLALELVPDQQPRLWALPRAIQTLRKGENLLNPAHAWPNRPTYECRLARYATRGFAVAVPGLPHEDDDNAGIQVDWRSCMSGEIASKAGLDRLCHIAANISSGVCTGQTERDRIEHLLRMPCMAKKNYEWSPVHGDHAKEEKELNGYAMRFAYGSAMHRLEVGLDYGEAYNNDPRPEFHEFVIFGMCYTPDGDGAFETPEIADMSPQLRDESWERILDAGPRELRIPRRLTFQTGSRMREYTNEKDSSHADVYLSHALVPVRSHIDTERSSVVVRLNARHEAP